MKKGFKAVLSIALAATMMFGMTACGGNSGGDAEPAAEQGKVLNIWCWNDEFQSRFNGYLNGNSYGCMQQISRLCFNRRICIKW